jgi:hypothetical protein
MSRRTVPLLIFFTVVSIVALLALGFGAPPLLAIIGAVVGVLMNGLILVIGCGKTQGPGHGKSIGTADDATKMNKAPPGV